MIAIETEEKMEKSIASLKASLQTIRAGRATTSLLDRITIDYYGEQTPVNQVASISIPEPRQLLIKPYDKNDCKAIVGAINASDLGINPINDGTSIRLIIPALNEERRKELTKLAKKYCEESKVAIRNIRRDQMDALKKEKDIPEDLKKSLEDDIQKVTDSFVKKIDDLYVDKEKDILQI